MLIDHFYSFKTKPLSSSYPIPHFLAFLMLRTPREEEFWTNVTLLTWVISLKKQLKSAFDSPTLPFISDDLMQRDES